MTTEQKEWVDWMPVKVLQKAVVIDMEGNILVLRRTEIGPGARPGKWDLPGGSMSLDDLGDNKQDSHGLAIKREVGEETGLDVNNLEVVHVASGGKQTRTVGRVLVLAIGYRCQVKGVKPKVVRSNEHVEDRWIIKKELFNLDFGEDGGFHSEILRRA
jgi:8-oxo-dGTP pyrophosphatase MutT (NUDIX family)